MATPQGTGHPFPAWIPAGYWKLHVRERGTEVIKGSCSFQAFIQVPFLFQEYQNVRFLGDYDGEKEGGKKILLLGDTNHLMSSPLGRMVSFLLFSW